MSGRISLSDFHPARKRALISFLGVLALLCISLMYREELYLTYLEPYVGPEPEPVDEGKISYRVFPSIPIECIKHDELEKLVHTNGSRTIVYVYYHNNNSHFAARKFAYCKDWIVPIFIPRSSYMESEVYRHHFMQLQHNWTEHYDFVLTCTFRHTVPTETRVTPLSTESLKHMIKTAVHMNYDVMPLEIYPIFDIKYSLLRFHGRNSFKAFSSLLEKKGYNRNQIEKSGDIRAFWRSSFLIRSSVMQNLTNWMVNAMHIVDNDTDVKWWFKHDAVYFSGDPIVAFQVFGTPYYQMHPFIFERLPAFYLSMERKSVYFYNRSVPIVPVVENSTMLS